MDINRYSPSFGIAHKHMVGLSDYAPEEIFELLYATKAMKAKFVVHEDTRILKNVTVGLLFGDTSLRTRSALVIGINQLGGTSVSLHYSESDMSAGENVKDIVQVLPRYGVGALVTRGIKHRDLREFCAVSGISIINSTNESCVPMQAICDMFTIWERKGKLEGLKIAYVGKGCANASSLVNCAVKCGLNVAVATPPEYAIDSDILDNARQYGNIYETDDPIEAVRGADIVYTDNYNYHASLSEKEKNIFMPYQVNNALISYAQHNVLFMHSLPAKRGEEVTAEIIDGDASLVLNQAENKLHSIKAVLALLIKE